MFELFNWHFGTYGETNIKRRIESRTIAQINLYYSKALASFYFLNWLIGLLFISWLNFFGAAGKSERLILLAGGGETLYEQCAGKTKLKGDK